MIKKIYSKISPDTLLHLVVEKNSFKQEQRKDLIPEDQFIQCAKLHMDKGKTFRPHKHIKNSRTYENKIAQESWVIISGKVKCFFYDLDDSLITTEILNVGDASFTLEGGHTYEILEDETIVYEYKTGPYEGQENDKQFLENDKVD